MGSFLKSRWLWAAVGVLVILVIAFIAMRVNARVNAAPPVTGQVTRGDIESQVLSSAALQPAADLLLTFGSGGTLTSLAVKPGDQVTKGQTLARLDTSD